MKKNRWQRGKIIRLYDRKEDLQLSLLSSTHLFGALASLSAHSCITLNTFALRLIYAVQYQRNFIFVLLNTNTCKSNNHQSTTSSLVSSLLMCPLDGVPALTAHLPTTSLTKLFLMAEKSSSHSANWLCIFVVIAWKTNKSEIYIKFIFILDHFFFYTDINMISK